MKWGFTIDINLECIGGQSSFVLSKTKGGIKYGRRPLLAIDIFCHQPLPL